MILAPIITALVAALALEGVKGKRRRHSLYTSIGYSYTVVHVTTPRKAAPDVGRDCEDGTSRFYERDEEEAQEEREAQAGVFLDMFPDPDVPILDIYIQVDGKCWKNWQTFMRFFQRAIATIRRHKMQGFVLHGDTGQTLFDSLRVHVEPLMNNMTMMQECGDYEVWVYVDPEFEGL